MTPNAQSAEEPKVPEIELFARKVQDLSGAVDFWNLVMLWGLALAALAAVVIGMSTRLVIVRSSSLAQAQHDLDTAKEAVLNTDLAEKATQLERLRNENLKLQERIAVGGHRSLRIAGSGGALVDGVKAFGGQQFEIGACPLFAKDFEVIELQMNIASQLLMAGWQQLPDREWHDCTTGVTIESWKASPHTGRAAETLANTLDEILGKYSIEKIPAGQVGHFAMDDPPDTAPAGTIYLGPSSKDVVLVVVGAHP